MPAEAGPLRSGGAMTTLVFPEDRSPASIGRSSAVALRTWLGGHWAILFSHPDDFDRQQLERDRWLSVVSRTFGTHGLRAIGLSGCACNVRTHGWLAELGNSCAAVLSIAPPPHGAPVDSRASALRAEIARSGPRFAMIIDGDLCCRRTMHYRVPIDLPSPLELAGWAVALQGRQEAVSDTSACTSRNLPQPGLTGSAAKNLVVPRSRNPTAKRYCVRE